MKTLSRLATAAIGIFGLALAAAAAEPSSFPGSGESR